MKLPENWLRWRKGRQMTGYDKLLILLLPFLDLHLLRMREGAYVPPHRDLLPHNKRHYRLNVVLWKPLQGGEFKGETLFQLRQRILLFRSDEVLHEVTKVESGIRYVLSLGVAI